MRLFDVFTTAADKLADKMKGPPTSLTLKSRFGSAVFAGHLGRARRALEGGAVPDVGIGWDRAHGDLDTFAMMRAAKSGDRKMIELLCEFGADIDKTLRTLTPLSAAALAGDTRLVEFLLEKGADPEKAVAAYTQYNTNSKSLLDALASEGLTDVHDLIKAALEEKQKEKAAPKQPVAKAAPDAATDAEDEPLTAPKTASFTKTKPVAVTP